jgi:hypothetical protein
MEHFRMMAAAHGQGGGGAPFKPKTLSGVPYDECISGLQKMIRRGKEKEALILMQELCSSGYPAAVARRLMIIAVEDIGLANPEVVAQVYTLCKGYLVLKKDMGANRDPEPLAIYMSVMLLARSPKNRETDDAQIWMLAAREKKLPEADIQKIIDDNPCISDRHTDRGKTRLRNLAAARGTTFAEEADREFLEEGSLLYPHVEVQGNRWGRLVGEMFHYDYERNLRGFQPDEEKPKPLSPEETEIVAELDSAGEFASADSCEAGSNGGRG